MMRKTTPLLSLFLFCLLTLPSPVRSTEIPTEIGGFKLGEDITDYPYIEYSDYLKHVVINDWHGFRKGIISYGTCARPGKIVEIKMKYEDSSKEFYEKLLERYKERFGKPHKWKGDPFGILYVWKWSFLDEDGNQINLVLQHNLHQLDENIGNVVKLSYPERAEEERLCFIEYCEASKKQEEKEILEKRMEPNWDYMIPR